MAPLPSWSRCIQSEKICHLSPFPTRHLLCECCWSLNHVSESPPTSLRNSIFLDVCPPLSVSFRSFYILIVFSWAGLTCNVWLTFNMPGKRTELFQIEAHPWQKTFPFFKCTRSVIWVHIGPCKWHSNVYPHSWDHTEFALLSSGGHPPSQSPLATAKKNKNMQEWSRLWLTACCSRASPCPDSRSGIWPSDVRVVPRICWQRAPKSHHFVRRSWGSWDVAVVRCAPGRKGSSAASTRRGAPADWGATRAQRPSCPCSSSYRA